MAAAASVDVMDLTTRTIPSELQVYCRTRSARARFFRSSAPANPPHDSSEGNRPNEVAVRRRRRKRLLMEWQQEVKETRAHHVSRRLMEIPGRYAGTCLPQQREEDFRRKGRGQIRSSRRLRAQRGRRRVLSTRQCESHEEENETVSHCTADRP